MKVIIIEDDKTKAKDLSSVVSELQGFEVIKICGSYQSGLKALFSLDVDVVILDMTLPVYDEEGDGGGGGKKQFGGELILKEMEEEGLQSKVIVVSQHDYFADYIVEINLSQLGERLTGQFEDIVLATILYDSSEFAEGDESGWRKQLKNTLLSCQKE